MEKDNKLYCIYVVRPDDPTKRIELIVKEFGSIFELSTRSNPVSQELLAELIFKFLSSKEVKANRVNDLDLFKVFDIKISINERTYECIYEALNTLYKDVAKLIIIP